MGDFSNGGAKVMQLAQKTKEIAYFFTIIPKKLIIWMFFQKKDIFQLEFDKK